jgi:hypothetical protein
LVREVREWVLKNQTFDWRGHTHTEPAKTEPVEFVGMFEMPLGVEARVLAARQITPNSGKELLAGFLKHSASASWADTVFAD